MTLNITLATVRVYVDSVIVQTLHDFPRRDLEGALLHYQPFDIDKIHPAFRDIRAAWYGMMVFSWSFVWNPNKLAEGPKEFTDFLKPEFKDKLALTYLNDNDAVPYAMQKYGLGWFESLLAQSPRCMRGTATPLAILASPKSIGTATFTSGVGLVPFPPLNITIPTQGNFVSWAQRGVMLKDAPHPEGAKLLHNFMSSDGYQNSTGSWSVRKDVPAPVCHPEIMDISSTNPVDIDWFLAGRVRIERLKLFFENKIGTLQGWSPLIDDL
ncbi:ABC transporter [Dactylonectria estremocensis]|uniref:ABC transporter n=1 Tax=Dactylonectria estremocensis TaxID=1079267 RepID=A0A9P9DUL9_9HYPO|nr:ABC transporter [Dactylonectria estremocensis]